MSVWLTGVVTCIYAVTSGTLAYEKRWGLAAMFAGYALANLGLMWELAKGGR